VAQIRIIQRWADSSETELEVYVEDSYPDAVDEARAQVVKLWRETCVAAPDADAG